MDLSFYTNKVKVDLTTTPEWNAWVESLSAAKQQILYNMTEAQLENLWSRYDMIDGDIKIWEILLEDNVHLFVSLIPGQPLKYEFTHEMFDYGEKLTVFIDYLISRFV